MTSDTKDQLELAFLRLQSEQFKALAQLVIETLTAQRLYFQSRTSEALVVAKQLEKRLADRATAILKAN
jgi:hypothetical protein